MWDILRDNDPMSLPQINGIKKQRKKKKKEKEEAREERKERGTEGWRRYRQCDTWTPVGY